MIYHLFTLVWNRKRSTLLVMVELFFCFLVVCALFTSIAYLADHYNHPLGFSYERVWQLSFERPPTAESKNRENRAATQRLMRALRTSKNIEEVACIHISPFSFSAWNTTFDVSGRNISAYVNLATEQLAKVLDMPLTGGRWFRPGDEALSWIPIVINEKLGREIYGSVNPVGQIFPEMSEGEKQRRVIGVISDFRQDGKLAEVQNYFFEYINMAAVSIPSSDTLNAAGVQEQEVDQPAPPNNILIRVAPGTSPAFEERVLALAQAEVPDWQFKVEPLEDMHSVLQRMKLIPLLAGGIVAVFFLLMVALGLIGVIWQNVTRRTGELGLRRAVGATTGEIYRQVLGELLALTTFSLIAGLLVAVQFPILDLLSDVSAKVYTAGFLFAIVFMYGIVLVCGLYPATLATRVQPTEALHYE